MPAVNKMPSAGCKCSCPVEEKIALSVPCAVELLPENNKTTAIADRDCVHQIAFQRERLEELGTTPPPRTGLTDMNALQSFNQKTVHVGLLHSRKEALRVKQPGCPWPRVLDPVLHNLGVHVISDGLFLVHSFSL